MKSPKRRRLERRPSQPELLEARIAPATILVTNTNDNGAGSLRQAILDANSPAFPGPDLISFASGALPSSGALVIPLQSPLPVITETLTIDGYTAAGTSPNTAGAGTNAVLRVMLDGSLSGGNGLVFFEDADSNANGSVVRGLVISGFNPGINESGFGVFIKADNVTVAGNFIGTDLSGTQIFTGVDGGGTTITGNRNAGVGIGLFGTPDTYSNNIIGGINPQDRNILSGNASGVSMSSVATDNLVLGNLIGTDRTGSVALPNNNAGIGVAGNNNTIGGTAPGAGNVISGNNNRGIDFGSGSGLTIQGNLIGVAADGQTALPNQGPGIRMQFSASSVTIGGSAPGAGNVIAANLGAGVQIGSDVGDGPADTVLVQGNFIGTDKTGTRPLGNQNGGINVSGSAGSQIGGINPGEGNVISFNTGAGIRVAEEAGPSSVQILGNGIRNNSGLGIDLVGGAENFFGVTADDNRDVDGGPNGLTNWPVLEFVSNSGTAFALDVMVAAAASTAYRIEFFAIAPDQLDLSGHGEGTLFLGSLDVLTNGAGLASANFTDMRSLPPDTRFTATITSVLGGDGTSEFSPAVGPADTYTWTGAQSSNWFDPLNWSSPGGPGVPGPLDTAIYGAGAANPIQLDASVSVAVFQHSAGAMLGTGQLAVRSSLSWTGGSQEGPSLVLAEGANGLIDGGAGNALLWNKGNFGLFGAASLSGGGLNFNDGILDIGPAGSLVMNAGIVDQDGIGTLSLVANNGRITKLGSGAFGFNTTSIDSSGLIEARAGSLVLSNYTGFGGSRLTLNGGNVQAVSPLTLDTDAELHGSGVITGDVDNLGGYIFPGGDGGIGVLNINGSYTQGASATLVSDIRGISQGTSYDHVNVQGAANIDGILNVSILPGFAPTIGNAFNIIAGGPLTGTFDTIVGEGVLTENYTATAAQLVRVGQTFVWDAGGAGDTSWFNAQNWNPTGVPGPGDAARLDTAATITLDAGNATVGDFIQSDGLLTGANTLTTLGSFQWSGGTQAGAGTTVGAPGSSTLLAGSVKTLDGRTLSIQGNGVAGGGAPLTLSNNGLLLVGGLLDLQNPSPFQVAGSGTLEIAPEGTLLKSVTGGASLGAALTFQLDGLLDVQVGSLLITSGGGATAGIFRTAPGAVLQFNSGSGFTVGPDSVFEGGGSVQIVGGTLGIGTGNPVKVDAATTFELATGTLSAASGNFAVDGNFRWTGGAISGGGNLTVNGAFDITGSASKTLSQWQLLAAGSGQWDGPGTVTLELGANLDISGAILINSSLDLLQAGIGGGFEVLPAGALEVDGVAVTIAPPVQSAGTFRASNSASVTFNNGFVQSAGALFIDGGSTLTTPALVSIGGGFVFGEGTIAGSLDNSGGVVSPGFDLGDSGTLTITTNYIQGPGGTLLIEARGTTPGSGYDQLIVGATESLDGIITFLPIGAFSVPTPSTFNVLTGASTRTGTFTTANVPPGGAVAYTTGGANVVFAAAPSTFVWDGGGGDSAWDNPLNWNLDLGFPGATDAAILSINSTIDLGSTPRTVTSFQQSAGTLTGAASLTVTGSLVWNGGAMSGAGTTFIDAAATATLGGSVDRQLTTRTLNNAGTLNWSGTGQIVLNGAKIDNSGAFNLLSDATMAVGSPSTFNNLAGGTLEKNGGTGLSTISIGITVNNAGTVRVVDGDLDLGSAYTQTAGLTQLAGGTFITPGTLTFAGGELTGLSTISGSVSNTGAVIRPGGTGQTGSISILGNYSQGSGGTLAAEIGGLGVGNFDALSVSGSATLAGTLDLSHFGGFTPAGGDAFRVVASTGNPGTFTTLTGATTGKSQTPDGGGLVITQAASLVYVWDNSQGDGNWFNPLNWDLDSGVPGAADTAILNINSTINLSSNTSVGTFQQSAGTFTSLPGVTFTVLNAFDWTGGTQSGAGTTESQGTLTINAAPKTLDGRTLSNTGTANVNRIELSGSAIVSNAGIFNLQSNTITDGGLSGVVRNLAGATMNVTGSTYALDARLENAGTIDLQGGQLGLSFRGGAFSTGGSITGSGGSLVLQVGTFDFSGSVTVSGTATLDLSSTAVVNVAAGSTLTVGSNSSVALSGGTLNVPGTLNVSGSFTQTSGSTVLGGSIGGGITLALQGGELRGIGTITGGVNNTGATVRPGGSGAAGTLDLTGDYFQSGSGALEIELSGTSPGAFDILNVGGIAALGGALTVTTFGGFTITPPVSFSAMTYSTRSGTFAPENLPPGLVTDYQTGALLLTAIVPPDPLVVNTDLDIVNANDAFTSLREAILFANSNTGIDTITFNIPGTGVHTLQPATALPALGDATIIDGYSQLGSANTESLNTFDANITIVIDGSSAGSSTDGLTLGSGSSGSTIKGVALQHFGGFGVRITSDNNFVTGIVAGGATSEDANTGGGIFVSGTANTIGGSTRADRNLISGNTGPGVLLDAAAQTRVEGNFIGTDTTGAAARSNATGIELATGSTQSLITGNVISGNVGAGVFFQANGGTQNTLTKNLIGTATNGTAALANGIGVRVGNDAISNTIGGTTPGEGNTIAFNTGNGVQVEGAGTVSVRILGNTIVGNGALGIDLGNDGATANDATDSDIGPNGFINFPVLTSANFDGAATTVQGSVTTATTGTVRIEFFLAATGVFLGAQDVPTVAGSAATFTTTLGGLSDGDQIIATTTDTSVDGTSEFSAAVTVIPPVLASIGDAAIVEGNGGTKQLVFKVTLNQAVPATVTVSYDTAAFSADARSATDGVDYTGVSGGLVTFGPNQLSQTIAITLNGDTAAEPTERFTVMLSNATNAGIDDGEGVGAILDDDHHTIALAQGNGSRIEVFTTTATGATVVQTITAFGEKYKGGVRVAVGDVNGDGVDDVIAGAGLGGRAKVRVFDGANNFEPMAGVLGEFSAYGRTYRGGVFVAAGDVNGDGKDDVIVTPSAGSSNRVNIFSGADGALLSSFRAFGKGTGGVRVAAGDVNGDGLAEVIVGTGVGSSVRVFDALNGMAIDGAASQFRAFGKSYRGGVFVAAGDLNADGKDDIIVSAGAGTPHIRSYLQGVSATPGTTEAYTGARFGARISVLDINADGVADIIAAKGRKGDNLVRAIDGVTKNSLFTFTPLSKQLDGLYVG